MLTKQDKKFLTATFASKDDLKAMEVRQDKKYATKDDLKQFATKDDLKKGLDETKTAVVKEITDYLQNNVINLLSEHDTRLDRLEKTVGGFPPLPS